MKNLTKLLEEKTKKFSNVVKFNGKATIGIIYITTEKDDLL